MNGIRHRCRHIYGRDGGLGFWENSILRLCKVFAVIAIISSGNSVFADPEHRKSPVVNRPSDGIDILEGKRLFFESDERKSHQSGKQKIILDDVHDAGKAEKNSGLNSKKNRKQVSPLLAHYRLRYDGYLESVNSVGIIVNGIPCHLLSNDSKEQLKAIDLLFECPGLKGTGLKLILLANTTSLKVTRGQETMAIIKPGQSL